MAELTNYTTTLSNGDRWMIEHMASTYSGNTSIKEEIDVINFIKKAFIEGTGMCLLRKYTDKYWDANFSDLEILFTEAIGVKNFQGRDVSYLKFEYCDKHGEFSNNKPPLLFEFEDFSIFFYQSADSGGYDVCSYYELVPKKGE